MNSLDARLIELNQALLKLASRGESVDQLMVDKAIQVLSGSINTGPGNDTVIINNPGKNNCTPGEQGPPGPPGEQGPPGPPGPPGECDSCKVNTKLVSETYYATDEDCYIGVNSSEETQIFLPSPSTEGKIIIIKSEMDPPMGNRKIIVQGGNGETIDGKPKYTITIEREFVSVLYRGGSWNIIG